MPASTPDISPVRPSRLRLLGRALLGFFLLLWIAFVGVATYQGIYYAPPGDATPGIRLGLPLLFLAGPLWVFLRRIRSLRNPPPFSLPASMALLVSFAGFLAWLAHDDAEWRHAGLRPGLRNDFPEAAATHALTLRYSKNAPGSLLSTLPDSSLGFPTLEPGPANDIKWTAFLAQNGPAIDALWTELAPLRAWVEELAAAPVLGDLTAGADSPVISFKALRLASQFSCARALQLAASGRRDEAVETLLPVLMAAQKLEPHARTLVRRMTSIVLRRQVQNTLTRILAGGPLSAETRARLVPALAPRPDAAAQAELLVWCEYEPLCKLLFAIDAPNATTIFSLPGSENPLLRAGARIVFTVLLNPNLTANRYGDHLALQAAAAARRDFSGFEAEHESFGRYLNTSLPGKNHGGRMLLAMAVPSYRKVLESYWKSEDERAALLARLQAAH